MPTVEEDNASTQTETEEESPPETTQTEDDITSHPKYKELEEKHAAARKGMDESNLTKKQLQAEVAKYKTLAGIEEEEPEEEEEKPLTRAELQEQLWELKHGQDIEVYADDEYKADVENGIPKEYALKMAKLRAQANPDKARLERNKLSAQGSSSSTREIDDTDITEKDREGMAKWGYSEEALRKQKELKKERGR